MNIQVSWEEIQAGEGLHPHGELWIRVLSEDQLEPSMTVPALVAAQVSPEILGGYRKSVCDWHPDLRQADDETIKDWPHEQWWALPKIQTSA